MSCEHTEGAHTHPYCNTDRLVAASAFTMTARRCLRRQRNGVSDRSVGPRHRGQPSWIEREEICVGNGVATRARRGPPLVNNAVHSVFRIAITLAPSLRCSTSSLA